MSRRRTLDQIAADLKEEGIDIEPTDFDAMWCLDMSDSYREDYLRDKATREPVEELTDEELDRLLGLDDEQ